MASHVSLRKSAAILLAVLLVFVGAGCGKPNSKVIVIPKSYYDYFGASAADDLAAMKALSSDYVTRAYRRSGGIVIVADDTQKKNLLKENQYWISYYSDLILKANPDYSIKTSKDFRKAEFSLDYKMDAFTRNEAIEGLSYWYVLSQLFHGAGDKWGLDITIRDSNSGKVVYRVSLPKTPIDFNDETWNL